MKLSQLFLFTSFRITSGVEVLDVSWITWIEWVPVVPAFTHYALPSMPLARFISDLNPEIPYRLLAFYPHFYLQDLPTTSRGHALGCKEAAHKMGLKNVHLGNVHLLRDFM